jgi:hypothetical protein
MPSTPPLFFSPFFFFFFFLFGQLLTSYESISTVFAISVSTAPTGTSAPIASPMRASSTPATDLFQSLSPSTTSLHYLAHITARLAITASTVTGLFATRAQASKLTSKAIDTSVLYATTPTSVRAARPAPQISTTELTLSSSSRLLSAMSMLPPWAITRMASVCLSWETVVDVLHPNLPRPPQHHQPTQPPKFRPLLTFSQLNP